MSDLDDIPQTSGPTRFLVRGFADGPRDVPKEEAERLLHGEVVYRCEECSDGQTAVYHPRGIVARARQEQWLNTFSGQLRKEAAIPLRSNPMGNDHEPHPIGPTPEERECDDPECPCHPGPYDDPTGIDDDGDGAG
jgi:hypothetical protein